jgi:hypothetical protein
MYRNYQVPSQALNYEFKGGFPDRMRVRLCYVASIPFTSSSTLSSYVFRGNSVFDPDFTSTGGQPGNYDDFVAQYEQYRVHGSTIQIWHNMQAGSAELALAARHTSTAQTTFTQLDSLLSVPYVKHRSIATAAYASNRGGEPTLSMTVGTEQFLGIAMTDDTVSAVFNANPANPWYYHIYVASGDQSTSVSVQARVVLTYDVEFFDRVETGLDLKIERMKKMFHERQRRLLKIPSDRPPETPQERKNETKGWFA